jgi:hypothetical protein
MGDIWSSSWVHTNLQVLYHFDQFCSHTSQALVFCWKSVLVMRHQGLCRIDPTCDKAEKGWNSKIQPRFQLFRWVFVFFASHGLWQPQFTTKCIKNCPFRPYQVSKILLGHGHWPSVSKCRTDPMCHSHRWVLNWLKWYSSSQYLLASITSSRGSRWYQQSAEAPEVDKEAAKQRLIMLMGLNQPKMFTWQCTEYYLPYYLPVAVQFQSLPFKFCISSA